jgi:hypothetical protein
LLERYRDGTGVIMAEDGLALVTGASGFVGSALARALIVTPGAISLPPASLLTTSSS